MWKREIVTWGNSLGLRIPNKVFQKTNFKEGDTIHVEIDDEDALVIRRAEDTADR
jgi:antitoxin component of MazEF toxin-antitoxin module